MTGKKLSAPRLRLLKWLERCGGSIYSSRIPAPTKRLVTAWMNEDCPDPLIDRVWDKADLYLLALTPAGRAILSAQEGRDVG
jgi:hypothetical protein